MLWSSSTGRANSWQSSVKRAFSGKFHPVWFLTPFVRDRLQRRAKYCFRKTYHPVVAKSSTSSSRTLPAKPRGRIGQLSPCPGRTTPCRRGRAVHRRAITGLMSACRLSRPPPAQGPDDSPRVQPIPGKPGATSHPCDFEGAIQAQSSAINKQDDDKGGTAAMM